MLCLDVVSAIRNEVIEVAEDPVFNLLIELHAHALHIAKEIGCLMKNGYSNAAIARWRALYETTIIAFFIDKNGPECAEHFISHSVCDSYKLMTDCIKNQERLNQTPPTNSQLEDCKKDYEHCKQVYGDDFVKPYGWTRKFIPKLKKKDKIGFATIESCVDFNHWRYYYTQSSSSVHCNYYGLMNKLGLSEAKEKFFLIGQSNSDMAVPCHATAVNLFQLTSLVVLKIQNASLDYLMIMKIIEEIAAEIGIAFMSD